MFVNCATSYCKNLHIKLVSFFICTENTGTRVSVLPETLIHSRLWTFPSAVYLQLWFSVFVSAWEGHCLVGENSLWTMLPSHYKAVNLLWHAAGLLSEGVRSWLAWPTSTPPADGVLLLLTLYSPCAIPISLNALTWTTRCAFASELVLLPSSRKKALLIIAPYQTERKKGI